MSTFHSRIAMLSVSLTLAAAAAHAATFQRQISADPRGEVDVSNVAGSIVIDGWDKPLVSVTADLPSGAERVDVTSAHGRTRVCVTYGSGSCESPGWFHGSRPVRLELHVPAGSDIRASAVSASISSRGIVGTQHLHTVSGDIDADLGAGNDDVKSVSGSIRLHGSGHDGTLLVSTVSGDLSVKNVAGDLQARTVNGRLSAGVAPVRSARLNTTSGDIDLSARLAPGGTIDTETVSGNQKIDVAAPAGYSYEAKSFSGGIEDCFGQSSDRNHYGPGSRLEGTRGAGDGHVRIRTLSGEVSLCDH
jgi:DUF4097 and DUF4098 domain-containing protein YvlB